MALSITNYGDNPSMPVSVSEAYIPDQLIAGNLKLVTDNVTITGGLLLQRGTVLGAVSEVSTPVTSTGKVAASGTIVVAALPVAGDTLTVFGTAITFVAADPVGNQVLIGATTALTAQALLNFLLSSRDANIIKGRYSLVGSTITATAVQYGTGGNALTLATSNAPAFTVPATLSSGAANTGNATISAVTPGVLAKPGTYVAVCLSATTAQVYDPNSAELGVVTFATPFTSNQINFTITAGGTPCAAGDMFFFTVGGTGGSYKLAAAGAVDGSEVPAAILVDLVDATGGDVANAGIYLMGEFNARAIIYDPTLTLAGIKAALGMRGIFIKTSVSASDPI